MANKKIFLLFFSFFIFTFSSNLFGQYVIDTTHSAQYLVQQILLGQGVLVGNVTYRGAPYALASFADFSKVTEIEKGIILTSGSAYYLKGPNRSTFRGWASGEPGDQDLNSITQGTTHDAAVLEFDFVTTSENLSFRYVFGSEEYQEYVGSQYNDVFAFFINGPGLDQVNLARIPGTETPITINNVNHKKNRKYYRDNDYKNNFERFIWDERNDKVIENKYFGKKKNLPRYDIQYDGFTTLLTAHCKVVPGEIYHIKLAVADVADGILDSGVLLQGGSFQSYGEKVVKLQNPFPSQIPQQVATVKAPPAIENEIAPEPVTRIIPQFQPEIVYFEFDSHYTKEQYQQQLNTVVDWYKNKSVAIEIVGHTDSIGSQQYNLALSRKRAESVREELIAMGLDQQNITITYYGENMPTESNGNENGRAKNRRVELVLKSKESSQVQMNASKKMDRLNNSSSGVVY